MGGEGFNIQYDLHSKHVVIICMFSNLRCAFNFQKSHSEIKFHCKCKITVKTIIIRLISWLYLSWLVGIHLKNKGKNLSNIRLVTFTFIHSRTIIYLYLEKLL